MYIVRNKEGSFGAIQVCLEKAKLKAMFPKGYIVIPSSIHECIVIPKEANVDDLNDMVNAVNDTEVAAEEQLGNRVYIF